MHHFRENLLSQNGYITNKVASPPIHSKMKNKCRRSKRRNCRKQITIMYANIQGFRGKKASLQHVMDTVEADIVMLTETMTKNVSVDCCECINPK